MIDKKYIAERYKAVTHHEAVHDALEPWNNVEAHDTFEMRYRIVSTETGRVLDDAQGYGYKTPQKAYAAFAYKNRDKSKDKEKKAKEQHIKDWIKSHKWFVKLMDELNFEMAKEPIGLNEKMDTKYVKQLLKDNELEIDFTASELLRVWKKH